MGTAINIQVVSNGQVLEQKAFNSDANRTIKIGRLPSAQIKIDDPKASRIHAVMEFSGNDVSLIDMGSTTGTLVNGNKIHKVKLNHGDKIVIGNTELVFALDGMSVVNAAQEEVGPSVPSMTATPFGGAANVALPNTPMAQAGINPAVQTDTASEQVAAGTPFSPSAMMPPSDMSIPQFDSSQAPGSTARRITQERLMGAAVESHPHPALSPEPPVSRDNRVLELRLYWGEILLRVNHYHEPKRITVGENKKTDIFLSSEGLPVEAFPLIRFINDEYVLTFTNQMEGEIELNNKVHNLNEIRASSIAKKDHSLEDSYYVALPYQVRAIIHWGGATFALRFVTPTNPIPNPFFKNMDLQYVNMLLLSIFFHIATVATMMVYPYDTESLIEDLFQDQDRFAKLILEQPQQTESTKDLLKKIKETVERKKEKKEVPPPSKTTLKISKEVKQKRPKKTQAQKQAEVKQKFTQMFSGSSGGATGGALLGGGGGGTLSGSLSNVIGTTGRGSATAGLAGLGIRSGALTGGGIGTSRGIAGIGTAGRLGGGGMGYGSGVNIGKRKDRNLIGFSTPVIMGALPKEVIQKVINQNKNQIRYCYEVELQRKQNLGGKVAVKWIIGATGSVTRVVITDSTIKSKNVEKCIRAKIKTWKFPAPAGGGIVEVNYPFVFRATG